MVQIDGPIYQRKLKYWKNRFESMGFIQKDKTTWIKGRYNVQFQSNYGSDFLIASVNGDPLLFVGWPPEEEYSDLFIEALANPEEKMVLCVGIPFAEKIVEEWFRSQK